MHDGAYSYNNKKRKLASTVDTTNQFWLQNVTTVGEEWPPFESLWQLYRKNGGERIKIKPTETIFNRSYRNTSPHIFLSKVSSSIFK